MNIKTDPRKQFSKKLAKWTAVFWFVYMAWLSALLYLQPSSAVYAVYMGLIATAVMMINVVAYTANSIQEKLLLAVLDKAKFELTLGANKSNDSLEEEGSEEEADSDG